MFDAEHQALALEFARLLAARDYAAAYDLCSAGLRARVSLEQLQQDFERIIPLDWGAIEPIEVVEGEDWPFVYVVLGGEMYSEAVIMGGFVMEENSLKVDALELGRP
jgi:hypothetical protein